MADLGNHQQTYGHGTAYYPGKATAEAIAAAKKTTFDVTTTEEATTTEEPTTEHTVHHFVTDCTKYNKDGEAGKIDETPAETTETEELKVVKQGGDVWEKRYYCGGCWNFVYGEDALNELLPNNDIDESNIYDCGIDSTHDYLRAYAYPTSRWTGETPYSAEELDDFDAHTAERNAAGDFYHGTSLGCSTKVGHVDDKYGLVKTEHITADAYDTYYLHYTCFDCGETMVGKVVHTYNGKKPEGYDGEISYASEKSETITFDKAGKTGGTSWNKEKLRYEFYDTTNQRYGVDVLEAGVEYDY